MNKNVKKVLFLIVLVALMTVTTPVFARTISSCDVAFGSEAIIDYKIPHTISLIVKAIRVIVPVILVLLGMIDLVKGITAGKEDEIKKGQSTFIKRLIAAALVFFVFVIVQLLVSLVADSNDKQGISDCMNCFINDTCSYK